MIIDVHTHTPRFPETVPEDLRATKINTKWSPKGARPLVYTWAEFEAAMAPVDRAIVFNIAQLPGGGNDRVDEPYLVPTPQVNDETAAFVNSNPEKYIGFLTVHPDDPGMLDEAERARTALGLRGLKLGLNYQNVDPLGENAFRLYAWAEAHGLPMLLHQGTSPVQFADIDYAHPRHTDRIAMAFPNLPIIMAHIGHPFCLDALVVARKHPRVLRRYLGMRAAAVGVLPGDGGGAGVGRARPDPVRLRFPGLNPRGIDAAAAGRQRCPSGRRRSPHPGHRDRGDHPPRQPAPARAGLTNWMLAGDRSPGGLKCRVDQPAQLWSLHNAALLRLWKVEDMPATVWQMRGHIEISLGVREDDGAKVGRDGVIGGVEPVHKRCGDALVEVDWEVARYIPRLPDELNLHVVRKRYGSGGVIDDYKPGVDTEGARNRNSQPVSVGRGLEKQVSCGDECHVPRAS